MALKMDRQVDATELGYFVNTVAERGVVLTIQTAGSGIALDSPINVAQVSNASSGTQPLGILLNDFVNLDLTRLPINWMKDQAQIGNKATILTKGWVVTNQLVGTPQAGQVAVLASSGQLAGVNLNQTNPLLQPVVGRFRESINEAGYARVYVDL